MQKRLKALASLGLGILLVAGSVDGAYPAFSPDVEVSTPRLATYGVASAPIGLIVFCMQQPEYCRGGGAEQLRLTSDIMNKLQRINHSVNRGIHPRSDKGDVWSVNVSYGDCEDYALTKRAKLIASGLPASALRMATVRTRTGEGHAVLVVRTDKGDYVLDNLSGEVKAWNRTGLRWIAMSGASLLSWRKI